MSTEYADWVAAHDQSRAQVDQIMRNRWPFMIFWIDEEKNEVGSAGMCRVGDEKAFAKAFARRLVDPDGRSIAGPRPGDVDED